MHGASVAAACTDYLTARDTVHAGPWAALGDGLMAGREELAAIRADLRANPERLVAMRDDLARDIDAAGDDPERLAVLARVRDELVRAAAGL
ncbi:hypothetical protein [Miltoncostaea oceani]|uniref:hypothetical protein n=1 Tax=Miltoncostaea oceani TaxID=2843216 RepID=UPI001C3C6A4F|nr:hypothetical protein [Miltoncostaea oceani]